MKILPRRLFDKRPPLSRAARLLIALAPALIGCGGVALAEPESTAPTQLGTRVQLSDPVFSESNSGEQAPSFIKPDPKVVQNVAQLLDECLTAMMERSSDADTQYYENGVWRFKNVEKAWAMQTGPGVAAAVLWKWRQAHLSTLDEAAKTKQPLLHKIAVETFDRAIKDHLNPDGSFDDPAKPDTYFFAVELGSAYLELHDSLDPETRQRWVSSLENCVAYMIKHGDLPNADLPDWLKSTWKAGGWYANGNLEVGKAEMLYMVWKATGNQKYKDLFETQWKRTMVPDPHWVGFGLYLVKTPTKTDGSDGTAYLAESGGKGAGYDGGYTLLDMDVLGRLYVFSRDPRVLRLLNMTVNYGLAHVDQSTWVFDATNGTRHSLKIPFGVCGTAVAAWLGGRADFVPFLASQLELGITPHVRGNAVQGWNSPGFYRSYGNSLAVWLQAASIAEQPTAGATAGAEKK